MKSEGYRAITDRKIKKELNGVEVFALKQRCRDVYRTSNEEVEKQN